MNRQSKSLPITLNQQRSKPKTKSIKIGSFTLPTYSKANFLRVSVVILVPLMITVISSLPRLPNFTDNVQLFLILTNFLGFLGGLAVNYLFDEPVNTSILQPANPKSQHRKKHILHRLDSSQKYGIIILLLLLFIAISLNVLSIATSSTNFISLIFLTLFGMGYVFSKRYINN